MRQRFDASTDCGPASHLPSLALRDAPAVAELFLGIFERDLLAFFPGARFERIDPSAEPEYRLGPDFAFDGREVALYGLRHRLAGRDGAPLPPREERMVRAIGAVLGLRYHHLFELTHSSRLELYRGGSEDHYVAAFVEPGAYAPPSLAPSRVAAAIHTLRTAALSTYENQRVSTGALLAGVEDDAAHPLDPAPEDALEYAVELTALKSIHRLCDGEKTLFLVDGAGKLAGIADVGRWACSEADAADDPLCARTYAPHARATREGGRVCVVLSPNQEIKVFAEGAQAFAFTHGRWRMLDPRGKLAAWTSAVSDPSLARSLFAAALNLSESRKGALFVVARDPARAVGRLVAADDALGGRADADRAGARPDGPGGAPLSGAGAERRGPRPGRPGSAGEPRRGARDRPRGPPGRLRRDPPARCHRPPRPGGRRRTHDRRARGQPVRPRVEGERGRGDLLLPRRRAGVGSVGRSVTAPRPAICGLRYPCRGRARPIRPRHAPLPREPTR